VACDANMDRPPAWLGRVGRVLTRRCGGGPGDVWVVAVSGGSDSVGLLRALHALAPGPGLRLSVAHLDHGARGEAARGDAAFVADLAAALGLPFDLGRWRPGRAGHFEADARRARYAWLIEVARARGASAVAVGHTRDDQAETILHRIVRGTGLRGLAGIPLRRPLAEGLSLVRPILDVTRDEVRDYLATLGQPYRDDASNADTRRTRARIRHDLLPRLAREYNPRVADALVRLGALAGAADLGLEESLIALEREATRGGCAGADPDCVVLDRRVLRRSSRFLRAELLRRVWRGAGWPEAGMDARRWRRLAALAKGSRVRASVGGGIEVTTDPSTMVLRRVGVPAGPTPGAAVPLDLPGVVPWGSGRVVATLDADAPHDETIDLDQLHAPVWVRAPVAGDRFEPLGMGGRSTPLNDFFRGRHVPRDRRAGVPLVCDTLGIVWVVGHRIAHRVRRTDATRRTLGLRFVPGSNPRSCG
jgi:tRNA(Ile)-lysidine synthase